MGGALSQQMRSRGGGMTGADVFSRAARHEIPTEATPPALRGRGQMRLAARPRVSDRPEGSEGW
jgi:hypothetical protein